MTISDKYKIKFIILDRKRGMGCCWALAPPTPHCWEVQQGVRIEALKLRYVISYFVVLIHHSSRLS